jgi:hypothetical protein
MRVVITTSDDYLHLLPGFCHQWNKYCVLPVTIIARNVAPVVKLPINVIVQQSPARYFDWSGSLRSALDGMSDEIVLLGLEDYWLADEVDLEALYRHRDYMTAHADVMRIDLTEDRSQYPHVMRDGYYQAVIDPNAVQYVLSTQFSLWRRRYLIHVLEPGVIPPQFEVELSRIAAKEQPVILGTGYKVLPWHGDGVVWNGKFQREHLHLEYLKPEDADELRGLGFA